MVDAFEQFLRHHHEPLRAMVAREFAELNAKIDRNHKETLKMSQTIQQTIDDNNTRISAALDGIQTDITAITAELAAIVPPVGSTVSQATADTMTSLVTRLEGAKSALDALSVPPTPPQPTP